jgi:hypothetical protein
MFKATQFLDFVHHPVPKIKKSKHVSDTGLLFIIQVKRWKGNYSAGPCN